MKNVISVYRGQSNNWQVRVTRNSIERTKIFSDSQYGSSGKALDAGIKYRDYLNSISITRFAAPAVKRSITPVFVGKHINNKTLISGILNYDVIG